MRKIHVVTQKELIRQEELIDCIAVVIDVFLATSTIAFLLDKQYGAVYATKNVTQAQQLANQLNDPPLLLGEINGDPVEGFLYPDSSLIQEARQSQSAIISSTNGTVAIEQAKHAAALYTSSLINGHIVAEEISNLSTDSSIVIICSGNAGSFSSEDFIGAGQIVEYLTEHHTYDLSDSAAVALDVYRASLSNQFKNLLHSRTAKLLMEKGYPNSINYVLDHVEAVSVLPMYQEGKIINKLVQ